MAVLKMGSKGKDVQNIQNQLNKVKAKLEVDGIFGKLTEKQTIVFQKKYKLKPDGKVGDNTLAALKFGGPLPKNGC
jgi:peptidoglycan hydrolase-like protein with peptidoglycan-binding domain